MPNGPNGERQRQPDNYSYNLLHVAGYTLAVVLSAGGGWVSGTKLAETDSPVQLGEQTRLTRAEFLAWVTTNNERFSRAERALDTTVQHRELDTLNKRLDRIEMLLDQLVKEKREALK